jgi:drug/metabolite transporter (DMT)-like permease
MYLVILLYALFGSLFALSKGTLNFSEPFFLIGSRMTFAGLLLLGHQLIWNREGFCFKFSHLKYLFLLGFLNIYLTNIAEIWGIQHMVSSKACLIYSLSPFLAAIVAYFVLKETLSAKKWLGLCIGFVGLIPIFMTQSQSEKSSGGLDFISLAEIALLLATFCSVYGWILLKKVVSEFKYSFVMANGISMTLGGILALIHSYFAGESWNPVPVTHYPAFIQNTILMCLISNIICYNLYGYLLKRYTATFMSFVGLVTPLFASLFGWIFLQETVTWHFFVSLGIFSIGLTIFYLEELKQEKIYVKPTEVITESANRS